LKHAGHVEKAIYDCRNFVRNRKARPLRALAVGEDERILKWKPGKWDVEV
jgi:hypothetical protein